MAQGKFIDKTGEKRIMNCGLEAEIIAYRKSNDIDVKFENGYIITGIQYGNFKRGDVKNPYSPTVCGIGYLGETSIDYDSHLKWKSMIERCYKNVGNERNKGYKNCLVCEDWHCYANFKKWYDENYYEIENERIHLDKDILAKESKVYSPDTCVFVPEYINYIFKKNVSKNKDLPTGITRYGNRYKVYIGINYKRVYLGTFDSVEEAFYYYKEAKEKEIKRVADLYKDKIPTKLYVAMYNYEVEITD